MHIQRQGSDGTQGFDHRSPDSDIGDKVTIHYIHMDVVGTALFYSLNLFTETGKICGKN
jgi:hypothetical protein